MVIILYFIKNIYFIIILNCNDDKMYCIKKLLHDLYMDDFYPILINSSIIIVYINI